MISRVDCPYVGLVPYTEEESRFFFGRENDQRVVISNLFASRLTILYGASGVGKSSLLRAGVIRGLRERAKSEPDLAVVYLSDWKGDALSRLKQIIVDSIASLGHELPSDAVNGALRGLLQAAERTFAGDVMIILDQFEEFFLYTPRDLSPGSFAYEFAEAANDAGLPASFMLSMRDDALSRLDRFKTLIPNLFANYLRIRHLTHDQARSAITRPLDAYNALTESERLYPRTMAIEPQLVDEILEEVRQDRVFVGDTGRGVVSGAEAEGIEAPYLQLVLRRVWAEEVAAESTLLRSATLARLGGAEQIVGTHVDGVLERLTEIEQAICARIFQFLVTPGGTKIAHALSDLADFANVSEAELTPVLERLSGSSARILSPIAGVGPEGPMQYEIYHDSLAHAILGWRKSYVDKKEREQREAAWAAENLRQQQVVEQAEALATAQHERAEAQARNVRLLRAMLAGAVVLTLTTAVIAWDAWKQRHLAAANEERAIESARLAAVNEERAIVNAKLAQESAADAQHARAEAARLAEESANARGNAQEALRFRAVAERAEAQARELQRKTEANISVVEDARRERDQLGAELANARQEITRLRGTSSSPLGPATAEATLIIRLLRIEPLNQGTSLGGWDFTVRSATSELLKRPMAVFDLGAEPGPDTAARIPTREGATVSLTIRGVNKPSGLTVDGAASVYVRPLAHATREILRVPVIHASDPERSAFVVVLDVNTIGPTAR